jgi:hypothetical protein
MIWRPAQTCKQVAPPSSFSLSDHQSDTRCNNRGHVPTGQHHSHRPATPSLPLIHTPCCPRSVFFLKAASSTETSLTTYQSTRRYIPEDVTVRELESHKIGRPPIDGLKSTKLQRACSDVLQMQLSYTCISRDAHKLSVAKRSRIMWAYFHI